MIASESDGPEFTSAVRAIQRGTLLEAARDIVAIDGRDTQVLQAVLVMELADPRYSKFVWLEAIDGGGEVLSTFDALAMLGDSIRVLGVGLKHAAKGGSDE